MPPTNMSVQPAATDSAGKIIRPPMKQEDHPEHRMPKSEHEGTVSSPFPHPEDGVNMERDYNEVGQ